MIQLILRTAASAVASIAVASAQSTFSILGVGSVSDMNSTGTAVVGTDQQGAFLWTANGGYASLGGVRGSAVAEDGTAVVGDFFDVNGMENPGIWTSGTGWMSLGGLGGQVGGSFGSAQGISGDGSRATGIGRLLSGEVAGFEWTPGAGMAPLQVRPESIWSWGDCISSDGSTIGGYDLIFGGDRALVWEHGDAPHPILAGQSTNPEGFGTVLGLSSNGEWACGTELGRAFLWSRSTGATSFGALHGWNGVGTPTGYALAVSDNGLRVIGMYGSLFESTATIWEAPMHYRRLDVVLAASGANLNGAVLSRAVDLSPDGRIILGEARAPLSPVTEWWIATLDGPVGSEFCAPAAPNSTGSSGVIRASGSSLAADNVLTLRASGLPLHSFGYFLNSDSSTSNPGFSGSQGKLCLDGSIGRFSTLTQNSGPTGTFWIPVDLTALPRGTGSVSVVTGQTLHFQAWYRDANPNVTSNFTSAVSVPFS